MPKDSNRVLVQQISSELGVSERTVRRALTGTTKGVWGGTARRVQEIRARAADLNYLPNGAARAMAAGQFKTIALLLSAVPSRSYLPMNLLLSISNRLASRNFSLSITSLPDEKLESEGFMPRALREIGADGFLIDYTDDIPIRMVRLINEHQVPSVWLNTRRSFGSISPDDAGAALQAVDHLVSLGHRSITYVDLSHRSLDFDSLHYSAKERLLGYEGGMKKHGLKPQILHEWVQYSRRGEFLEHWLKQKPRPTAIICYGGEIGSVITAAYACRLRVPRDLSVMSYGPERFTSPGIDCSMMLIPEQQIGFQGVDMILESISNPGFQLNSKVLPYEFYRGESTAPPRT